MAGLASFTAIVWVAVQWSFRVLVLLVLGAFLAETSPGADPTAVANYSAGKRAVELLLAAFERLGVSVVWLREVLMSEGGMAAGGRRAGGVLKRFRSRRRGVPAVPKPQREERKARVSLEGVSISLGDIRIVDGKFACYRVIVTPATGARWEVWRRMADMIKLKAALSKVASAEVDLPHLPHSYRRSFDASRLTRRRRSIQHFLQVALKQEALRDCDALVDFLSPEAPLSSNRGSFVGDSSPASVASAGGATSNGGIGDTTPPHSRLRSRTKSAAAGGGGGSGSGGGGGDREHADGAARERAVCDRSADLQPPTHEDEEVEDNDGDSSGTSDDDDEGFEGAAAAVEVLGQGGEFGSEATEAGGTTPSPRSPLETSPRSSGRKSIHYMKNAVMTGTRRIARHVPMSMPNTKTIQRHIPMPKGVPKIPKYYKRSSNRRSNNDLPETEAAEGGGGGGGGGSMADIFSGAYTSNGSRGGLGGGAGGDKSSHGVEELNGLTWQHDHEFEDSGSGVSGSGGGGALSPRRRSYLWKRPTTKAGAGGSSGVGPSGASGNSLLRPKSAGATSAAAAEPTASAALETGVTNELFDGSFFTDRREDQGAAEAQGVDLGERGEGAALSPPAAGREGGKDSPGRTVMGAGGGSAVQLISGVTDGGEDHRFRVRGSSFLDDGLEIQAEPAVCPLVYADLFITDTSISADSADQPATNGEASPTSGRVDHIATQGRCSVKIEELTARVERGGAGEGVDVHGSGDLGPPFLVILNFQIPGDPPLSLVAAWAVHPERLGPDSPDSLRKFFGLFYRLVDIPLSPIRPSSSLSRSSLWETSSADGGGEGGGERGHRGANIGSNDVRDEKSTRAIDKANNNESGENGAGMPPARDSCSNSSRDPSSKEDAQGSGRSVSAAIAAANGVLGIDDVRNQRLKLATRLLDAPQSVAEALPSQGSVLLGQQATLRYFRGERYLEVDVDLASTPAASKVTALCRQNAVSLALDVGVVLQGESAAELPESVLGVLRIEGLDLQDNTRHRLLRES
eukprot:g7173.t1